MYMPDSTYISLIALGTSVLSLFVSIYNSGRDSARLRVTSRFVAAWQSFDAIIYVDIVNTGRRTMILDAHVSAATIRNRFGLRKTVNWSGVYFEYRKGLALAERETHTIEIRVPDLIHDSGEDMFECDDMWIEDTLGHRHKIKQIRPNIAKLKAWAESQNPHNPGGHFRRK